MMGKFVRLENPLSLELANIQEQLAAGSEVVIQYSEAMYDSTTLEQVDRICRFCTDNLCVRFYSHSWSGLDCTVLKHLPNVKNLRLEVDGEIFNFSELKNLSQLKKLNISLFKLEEKEFLAWENLRSISELGLAPVRKIYFDLKHLAEFKKLNSLFINGHTKNIESVGSLRQLKKLTLCTPSSTSLDFLNTLPNLATLRLFLGGRKSLTEIKNYAIEELEIVRVRGFAALENIGEFARLMKLTIEDQLQLKDVVFGNEMPELRELRISNCKAVSRLDGIGALPRLRQLVVFKTSIEYSRFILQKLPESLKFVCFGTGKVQMDKDIDEDLKRRGYADLGDIDLASSALLT